MLAGGMAFQVVRRPVAGRWGWSFRVLAPTVLWLVGVRGTCASEGSSEHNLGEGTLIGDLDNSFLAVVGYIDNSKRS